MAFDDAAAMTRYYADLLVRHGDGPRAVGWYSAHIQAANFLQLVRVNGLVPGARVLDVGCGLGALKSFFDACGPAVNYTGWDICAPAIDEARRHHPDARFEVRDIVRDPPAEPFDFVFASGTLNLRLPDHEAWVAAMIHAMWDAAARALVFNLLSARYAAAQMRYADHDNYFYAKPSAMLELCLELGGQVVLDHAELAHSFAVYLYRHNPAPVNRLREHLSAGGGYGPAEEAVVEHYGSLGLIREGIEFLEGLPETAGGCDALGLLAFDDGDHEKMVAAFRRAAALEPEHAERWRRLATALVDAGQPADAVASLERALALDPDDADTRQHLERLRANLD